MLCVCVSVCCTLVKSTPRYKDHAMCVLMCCAVPWQKAFRVQTPCYVCVLAKSIPGTKAILRVSVCCAVPSKKHSGYKDHVTCVSVLCCTLATSAPDTKTMLRVCVGKKHSGYKDHVTCVCAVLYPGKKRSGYKDHVTCVCVLCCTLAKSIPGTRTMLRVSAFCAVPWQKAFRGANITLWVSCAVL